MFFDKKLSKLLEDYYLQLGLYPYITEIVQAMNTFIQTRHNCRKALSQSKYLDERKRLRFISQIKDLVSNLSVRTWDTFSKVVLAMNLEWCWGKRTSQTEFPYDIVRVHSLMLYTDLIEDDFFGDTKTPILRYFFFKTKNR